MIKHLLSSGVSAFFVLDLEMSLAKHVGTEKLNSSARKNSNLKSKLRSSSSYSRIQYFLSSFPKDSVLSLFTMKSLISIKQNFSSGVSNWSST